MDRACEDRMRDSCDEFYAKGIDRHLRDRLSILKSRKRVRYTVEFQKELARVMAILEADPTKSVVTKMWDVAEKLKDTGFSVKDLSHGLGDINCEVSIP